MVPEDTTLFEEQRLMKRSLFLIAAFGLVASAAFQTPAMAGPMYLITVSESVSVTENDGGQNILALKLFFNGTNGTYSGVTIGPISDATSNAMGTYATFPPLHFGTEAPVVTSSAAPAFVNLAYGPSAVYSLGGTVSFKVTSTTDSVAALQAIITKNGFTLTPPPNSSYTFTSTPLSFSVATIPEPSSMCLLGIGMAGFFTYRRLFKRRPAAA
jgi:hypothetical protein